MRVLIGTPAYGYQVTAEYHAAVLKLCKEFGKRRPHIELYSNIVGSALLAYNRNILANLALQNPEITHLLFIDADMGFQPELIAKMIDFGKPLIGVLSPHKRRRMELVTEALGRGADLGQGLAAATRFVGVPYRDEESRVTTQGDFMRMVTVGTGIMLVQRTVLEQLREACPELWTDDPQQRYAGKGLKGVLQVFDSYQGPDGAFLPEDAAFCRRWTERCGGEIWACFNAEVTHVGREKIVANYGDRFTSKDP